MSDFKRDKNKRPLVVPHGATEAKPYQRASSYGDVLDDTWNLRRWGERHVALGLAKRPDLLLNVSAHADDKNKLNEYCEEAKDSAGTNQKSSIGTTLHDVTERHDLGYPVPTLPDPYQGSIDAFRTATQLFEPVHVEAKVACDFLGVAGTLDRLYQVNTFDRLVVGDVKTGRIDYGAVKIAVQFAVYSRSMLYDVDTDTQTPVDIDQDWGVVVHLPAGKGTCDVYWIDLQKGWELALLAQDVRNSRKVTKKDLMVPVAYEDLI